MLSIIQLFHPVRKTPKTNNKWNTQPEVTGCRSLHVPNCVHSAANCLGSLLKLESAYGKRGDGPLKVIIGQPTFWALILILIYTTASILCSTLHFSHTYARRSRKVSVSQQHIMQRDEKSEHIWKYVHLSLSKKLCSPLKLQRSLCLFVACCYSLLTSLRN